MTGAWLRSLALSLALTLALELLFALCAKKRGRALGVTALVNCLTNPPVVLTVLLWRHYGLPLLPAVTVLLEALAIVTEAAIYRGWREFPHPWRFSLCANLFSYGVGELLQALVRIL